MMEWWNDGMMDEEEKEDGVKLSNQLSVISNQLSGTNNNQASGKIPRFKVREDEDDQKGGKGARRTEKNNS